MSSNRPGLSSIVYRLGTYSTFRRQMLEAINTIDGATGPPGLRPLTSRIDSDYTITIIDLWAAVGDILTFYQERYANESFLRTAQAPESLASLASLTGADVPARATLSAAPAPVTAGSAATAQLLLTVDQGAVVPVPTGLRVQSVPGPDEKPQTFETLQATSADWRFNRLRIYPGLTPADAFAVNRIEALLRPDTGPALSATLKPGDQVVLFTSRSTVPVEEKKIDRLVVTEDRVSVKWKSPIELSGHSQAFKFMRTFRLFGWNAPSRFAQASNLGPVDRVQWQLQTVSDNVYPSPSVPEEQPPTDHFGHPVLIDGAAVARLCLDRREPGLEVGRQLLVADAFEDMTSLPPVQGTATLVAILRIDEITDPFGPIPQTVTRLWVNPAPPLARDRRRVTIYELADELSFAAYADPAAPGAVWTDSVFLRGRVARNTDMTPQRDAIEVGLTIAKGAFQPGVVIATREIAPGRQLILSDMNGHLQSVHVQGVPSVEPDPSGGDARLLRIQLVAAGGDSGQLQLRLDPASAVGMGNLVTAGHGQTVANEVLGSADGSVPFQTFTLQKKPLTYTPDPLAGGLRSTLRVMVNSSPWSEVAGLANQPPDAEVYVVTLGGDGTVTVGFGDGQHGRIPPTGRANVTATYRYGTGAAGNVRAGSITTLLDRPTGLLAVTNPIAAGGGVEPGTTSSAKRGVDARVRTLGRAVTLRDFEDLALTCAGVAQAQASVVTVNGQRKVLLTVAGEGGTTPSEDDLARVRTTLAAACEPGVGVRLGVYAAVPIVLAAGVMVDTARSAGEVLEAARQAVLVAFSPDRLGLARPIQSSDLIAVLQAVQGVTAATVLEFRPKASPSPPVRRRIGLQAGRLGPRGSLLAAELAVVETPSQDVTIVQTGGSAT
ncbi:MAG: putative baseplate assembly protein [Chloroflexi bacterium]|nr:putative baseplate assembly protein [Chloroflexota bacterium]